MLPQRWLYVNTALKGDGLMYKRNAPQLYVSYTPPKGRGNLRKHADVEDKYTSDGNPL
jgi:hypothetical protein